MADEITVNIQAPQIGELASAVNEQTEQMSGVVDGLNSATQAMNASSEAMDSVANAVESVRAGGGSIGANGSPSGANRDLLDVVESAGDGRAGDLLERVVKGMSNRGGMIGQVGNALESVIGRLEGFGTSIEGATGALGQGGLAGAAGSLGGAFESLASKAGPIGAALAAIPMVLGAVEEGIDVYQNMKDVAIDQGREGDLGLAAREWAENKMSAMFSGLDEGEASAIQSTLIANRAAFGSEQYREGYAFSQRARTEYAMDAEKAARLYSRAVISGAMSVSELNSALESLKETSKETGITMTELTESYAQSVEKLNGVYTEGQASEVANALADLGLSPDQTSAASAGISSLRSSSGYGSTYNQLISDYAQRGYGEGERQFAAYAQMKMMGMNASDKERAALFMDLGGTNLQELYNEMMETGDTSRMQEVLESFADDPARAGEWDMMLSTLKGMGLIDSRDSTPKAVADALGRFSHAESSGANTAHVEDMSPVNSAVENMSSGIAADVRSGLSARDSEGNFVNGTIGEISSGPIGELLSGITFAMPFASSLDAISRAGKADAMNLAMSDVSPDSASEGQLDWMMAEMVRQGYVSADDFSSLTSDERYNMMREVAGGYQESGLDSWGSFVGKYGGDLSDSMQSYVGQVTSMNTRDREKLAADITIKFEGDLGEYLSVKRKEYEMRYEQDNAVM